MVDAAAHLGGRPIVAVRYSDADGRDRHRGVSHHTTTALALAGSAPLVAVPRGGGFDGEWRWTSPTTSTSASGHDGPGPAEDPGFFRWAAAAGVLAAQLLA